MSYEYYYNVHFLGAWITKHTTLGSSQSASIEVVLSQHNSFGQDGCGEWIASWWSQVGQQGKRGRSSSSKEHWIINTKSKTCGKLLTTKNQQQPTDWSAVPQTETPWLFLSKGIGPNETTRQIAAAAHNKGGYNMFMRKRLSVMLCLSIQLHLHRYTSRTRSWKIKKLSEEQMAHKFSVNTSFSFFFFWES